MRELLFQVEGLRHEGAHCHVIGRNCGTCIRVGDEFTEVALRGEARGTEVRLRIEAIVTYRRRLNQLDPGLTAELELSGDEVAAADPKIDLSGRSDLALFATTEIL
jgi:hypothetical protein